MQDKDLDSTLWLSPLILDDGFGVQFRDDHVHVVLSKDFKSESRQRQELWNVIASECERHKTSRVLVEGFLPEGERETADVIDAGEKTATVPSLWLAFSMTDFQPTEQTELYTKIAASRGVRVKFFPDAERALKWLRQNSPK
jgi:hypothetical protein